MKTFIEKWFTSFVFAVLVIVFIAVFSQMKIGSYVEANLSSSLQYQARNYLKKYPKLSPKIKILAFDDAFVSYLNRTELSMEEWYKILRSINLKKPYWTRETQQC